jgi:endo-1,4-beta-xylanase
MKLITSICLILILLCFACQDAEKKWQQSNDKAKTEVESEVKEKPKKVEKVNEETIYFGTPAVDGVKDSKYDAGKALLVEKFIMGTDEEKNLGQGASAKVWVLWDENALYVFAEVTDPTLSARSNLDYMQDSIEIFIDENNNKTPSYQEDDGQFRINYKNKPSASATNVEGFKSCAKITDKGYLVEAIIPFRTIIPKEGTVMGFDFQVNDDQKSGKRDSIAKWNDPTNDSWQSTKHFGNLIFKQ